MATVTRWIKKSVGGAAYTRHMNVRQVKNLGWFFRKARSVVITRFEMIESSDSPHWTGTGWEMFADFEDGTSFATQYASLDTFKHVMSRQHSLRGVTVEIQHLDGKIEHLKLGSR